MDEGRQGIIVPVKTKLNVAKKTLLILLAFVLLPPACTSPDATQPAVETTTPTIQVMAKETATSLPEARTDCTSRYPNNPPEQRNWPKEEWTVSTLEEHCLDRAKVEEAVRQFEKNYTTSSLLIIRHGELVYEKYFFPFFKPERRVPVYSITKSYLSALVGIARDQGLLDSLDHKVIEYFPEYFYPTTDPRMGQTTLRHLLTMSGGFVWLEDGPIEERWMESGNLVEASINQKLMEKPGTGFTYSSANAQLMSAILTKIVNEPLKDYAQRTLFSPLGIQPKDWFWGVDDQGYALGGWGMYLRPRDIARFGYLYLNDGYWDGKQIVSKDWVHESTSQQIDTSPGMGYGYYWWVFPPEELAIFEALGYGGQCLYIVPALDLVVVTTANVSNENIAGAPDPGPVIYQYIVKAVMDK
jgi:CubicO group peptidase (beta-lactamase class C family)